MTTLMFTRVKGVLERYESDTLDHVLAIQTLQDYLGVQHKNPILVLFDNTKQQAA